MKLNSKLILLFSTCKSYLVDFIERYNKNKLKYIWAQKNCHNYVTLHPSSSKNAYLCTTVGRKSYGVLIVKTYETTNFHLYIGNFVSFAENVTILLSGGHYINHLSTYPFKAFYFNEIESLSRGDVIIEDDVWVGLGVTIMSGVTIGKGAIIAANALVNKDVPPYAIVAGIPARIIKYRFSEEVINELIKFDYSNLSDADIINNIDSLYSEINTLNDVKQIKTIVEMNK